jgi:hypothetical protein
MTGIFKTTILGKVTNVADGTTKQGKAWFRANVAVAVYNFGTKKYETRLVNVVGFDRIAEAMKKVIKVGAALFAEGEAKPGKPFKTNSGDEVIPTDLVARDWTVAGIVPDREERAAVTEETDEADPFA